MFERILVVVDGSEQSMNAADVAVGIADRFDSELEALFVTEQYPVYTRAGGSILSQDEELEEERAYGQQVLESVGETASEAGVRLSSTIRSGMPSSVITEYAGEEGFDAIVIGKSGRTGLTGRILGSTTDRVLREGSVTTIVVDED